MKKKFLMLSIIVLFITNFWAVNVLAANISSAQIIITTSKTEYQPGDTVEFVVNLKDLKADRGIVGLGAIIEYDTNVLELKYRAEGCTNWENASIGSTTNRFATTRNKDENNNAYSKSNEEIIKIQFTVKEVTSEATTKVSLKNIELSNGSLYRIENTSSGSITIKPKTVIPTEPDKPDEPDEPDIPNTDEQPGEPNQPNTPDNNQNKPNNSTTTDNTSKSNHSNQTNHSNSLDENENSNNDINGDIDENNNQEQNNITNTLNVEDSLVNEDSKIINDTVPELGKKGSIGKYIIIFISICLGCALLFAIRIVLLNKKTRR